MTIKMIISFVLLPCLLCLINFQVSLANISTREIIRINSAHDWSTNILCRINGGYADDQTRENGYMAWAMTPTKDEKEEHRKKRFEAIKFFAKVVDYLNNKITLQPPKERLEIIAKLEERINVHGANIGGADEWKTSYCKGLGQLQRCGKRSRNEPTCNI